MIPYCLIKRGVKDGTLGSRVGPLQIAPFKIISVIQDLGRRIRCSTGGVIRHIEGQFFPTAGFNAVRLPFSFKDLHQLPPRDFQHPMPRPSDREVAASVLPPGVPRLSSFKSYTCLFAPSLPIIHTLSISRRVLHEYEIQLSHSEYRYIIGHGSPSMTHHSINSTENGSDQRLQYYIKGILIVGSKLYDCRSPSHWPYPDPKPEFSVFLSEIIGGSKKANIYTSEAQ